VTARGRWLADAAGGHNCRLQVATGGNGVMLAVCDRGGDKGDNGLTIFNN
jgi:hypothetical protein